MIALKKEQPETVAASKTPQNLEEGSVGLPASAGTLTLLARLSELRERHLPELQKAREKIKKNFLK